MEDVNRNKLQQSEQNAPKQSNVEPHVPLPTGQTISTSTPIQQSLPRKDHDQTEPHSGSAMHPAQISNSSQPNTKKKGGFMITSVKDQVDGDESADDLDESHTSYSEMSYSRTTDVDRDQESSASEDTLNITVQDNGQAQAFVNQSSSFIPVQKGGQNISYDPSSRQQGNQALPQTSDVSNKKTVPGSMSSVTDFPPELSSDSAHEPGVPGQGNVPVATSAHTEQQSLTSIPQSTKQPQQQVQMQSTTSTKTQTGTSNSGPSATTAVPTSNSKSTSVTTTAPAKGVASRVYKVVKRESSQAIKRERLRWTCYDYVDAQTPNLGFVAHSASDSRLNFHDQLHHQPPNILPMSVSSTSVPSSSSAYNLQHSDSTSSVQRDTLPFVMATGANVPMQHSASTSSVNYELDPRKLPNVIKTVNEIAEDAIKRHLNSDDGFASDSTPEQELLKNVMQSSTDNVASGEGDDESTSSRNVRIDNKIEAAMDLVKKHLMLAVRDEVDELKDKIVELQDDIMKINKENEALRGVLTPEQFAAVQPVLSRPSKNVQYQKPSSSQSQVFQPQQPIVSMQPIHDTSMGSQQQQQPAAHQVLSQKSSVPHATPLAHGYQPGTQQKNAQRGSGVQVQNQPKAAPVANTSSTAKQASSQLAHAQQPQAMASAQQQIMQKQIHAQQPVAQQPQQQGLVTRQVTFQHQQGQPLPVYSNLPQQAPRTAQPQHTLRHQAIQKGQIPVQQTQGQASMQQPQGQMPIQQGQSQPGFQSPQGVMQPGMPALVQQSATPQFSPGQAAYPQQNNSFSQPSQIPNQTIYSTQTNAPRQALQGNQPNLAIPRNQQQQHTQQTHSGITSPTSTVPSAHPHTYATHQTAAASQTPTSVHPQFQAAPVPSAAIASEQRPAAQT
ncbi:unnamed protein product [Clavelina lepadiformis]|uniref:TSC22 domain family protein 1 n=1 Tax=Clavelina lepadiformis TaxID=159417 RepID=A0ABP0GII3_CLALP